MYITVISNYLTEDQGEGTKCV